MTFEVNTGQIRQHANAVGGIQGNLRAMSDATVTMLRSRADRFGLCHTSPYRSLVV